METLEVYILFTSITHNWLLIKSSCYYLNISYLMILVTWFVSVNIQNPAIDYAKGLWVLFRFLCQNLKAWSNRIVKIVRRDGRPRPILCVLFEPFFSLTTAEVPQSRRESRSNIKRKKDTLLLFYRLLIVTTSFYDAIQLKSKRRWPLPDCHHKTESTQQPIYMNCFKSSE